MNVKSKFLSQLNLSFGSGGMSSSMDKNQLTEFLHHIQRAYVGDIPKKKAVIFPGRQSDGTWVLNRNTFLNNSGEVIGDSESLVWIDRDILYDDKTRSSDISPPIKHPLSTEPLAELVSTCEKLSKHNFIPTLVVIGGCMAAFHFETLVAKNSGCPIVLALGESETGKSTAIRFGLSLFGCDEISRYVKGTNAAFTDRACNSAIPFAIEEARGSKRSSVGNNNFDLSDLVMALSNGSRSTNMKTGSVKPKTVPVLSSNYDMENLARYVQLLPCMSKTGWNIQYIINFPSRLLKFR